MKRRIVRQGVATNTISLPAKWVQKHGIRPGQEVEVEEQAGKLVISTSAELQLPKIKVRLPAGSSRRLKRRYLDSVYRRGFDEIRVEFSDEKSMGDIEWALQQFVGFEIVEQGKQYCIIKNIIGPSESDFDSLFRRFLLLILDVTRESLTAILTKDKDKLKHLIDKDYLINRFYLFCQRLINRRGEKFFPGKETFMFLIVNRFEEIADVYRDLNQYCGNHPIALSEKTIKVFSEVNALVEKAYHLYYSFTDEGAQGIDKIKGDLTEKIAAILTHTKSAEERVILHYLLEIVTYAYETVSPIFSVSQKEELY